MTTTIRGCGPAFCERVALAGRALALVVAAMAVVACAPKGEALYARAAKSMEKGDARAALIDLKNLVAAEPQNAKARALLGQALVQAGDMPAGEIEIQKAKDLGAPRNLTLLPECRVLVAKGNFETALKQCQPAGAPAAMQPDLHIATGNALVGLGRASDATPHFEAAIAARPNGLEAYLGLASAAHASGGVPAAMAELDKVPAPLKERAQYWLTVGGLALEAKDLGAAERAFKTAVDKAGNDPESLARLAALGGLAETQVRLGKVKDANATSQQLVQAAPNNLLVKQLRAQIAAADGRMDEARNLLEEVVSAQPQNYEARTLLGLVNLQQGNLGQAEMHFANVVANRPNDARAQRLLAETRARTQSPQDTLASLKPALGQASADPSMLAMASRLSLANGDRDQAIAYLDQAAGQPALKENSSAQIEVASGYVAAGELDRAVALLQSMPQGGMSDFQREYLLMLALLRKGETTKALDEAQTLLKRSGNDPAVRKLVAGVYLAAGQRSEARAQVNEALKLKPDDVDTLLSLARLDLMDGKPADAGERLQKILARDPKNLTATLGMAMVAAARNDRPGAEKWLVKARDVDPKSMQAQLALVNFYLNARDFDKASAALDAADKALPDNGGLANARGMLMIGRGDAPGAIASFAQAVKLEPKAYGYALNLARAHLANRDAKSTFGVIDDVLKEQPKYVPALGLGAAAGLQAGELERTTGYLERLRQVAPDAPLTYQLDGDLALAQKRYKDAIVAYQKASAKAPSREVATAESNARRLAGDKQAEKPLADWVARNPDDALARADLAEEFRRQGRLDAAIRTYEEGLARRPDQPVLLNNLAVLYQQQGNPKALELGEKAYKLAPQSPALQDTYGWLLVQQGDAAKGLELLRSAAKGLPDNPEVQYHLAAALAKTGKGDEAAPLLKRALAGPLPPEARAEALKLQQRL